MLLARLQQSAEAGRIGHQRRVGFAVAQVLDIARAGQQVSDGGFGKAMLVDIGLDKLAVQGLVLSIYGVQIVQHQRCKPRVCQRQRKHGKAAGHGAVFAFQVLVPVEFADGGTRIGRHFFVQAGVGRGAGKELVHTFFGQALDGQKRLGWPAKLNRIRAGEAGGAQQLSQIVQHLAIGGFAFLFLGNANHGQRVVGRGTGTLSLPLRQRLGQIARAVLFELRWQVRAQLRHPVKNLVGRDAGIAGAVFEVADGDIAGKAERFLWQLDGANVRLELPFLVDEVIGFVEEERIAQVLLHPLAQLIVDLVPAQQQAHFFAEVAQLLVMKVGQAFLAQPVLHHRAAQQLLAIHHHADGVVLVEPR